MKVRTCFHQATRSLFVTGDDVEAE